MRPVACALLTILLSVYPSGALVSAEESGFWRWPFGRSGSAEPTGGAYATGASPRTAAATSAVPSSSYAQSPLPQASTSLDANQRWMYQSPNSKVSWPRIHMPEFTLPKPRLPRPQFLPRQEQVNEARNAWVQQNPNPARPSPLQAVRQGAQRVGDSTRRAWHKTVDVLTPGDPPRTARSSRIARRNTKPPIWKRMFVSDEPQAGPRTITEWMAQERLDP